VEVVVKLVWIVVVLGVVILTMEVGGCAQRFKQSLQQNMCSAMATDAILHAR